MCGSLIVLMFGQLKLCLRTALVETQVGEHRHMADILKFKLNLSAEY